MGIVGDLYEDLIRVNVHKYIRDLPLKNMRVYANALFVAEMLDMTTEELLTRMGFNYKFYTHNDVDVSLLYSQILEDFPNGDVTCYKATLKNRVYKTGISLIERRYGIGSGVVMRELGFQIDKYTYKVPNLVDFLTRLYPDKQIYNVQAEARIVSLIKRQLNDDESIYEYLLGYGFSKREGEGKQLREVIAEELENYTYAVRDTPLDAVERSYVSEQEIVRREITAKIIRLHPNLEVDARTLPEELKVELKVLADYMGLTPQKALESWGFKYNSLRAWNESSVSYVAPTSVATEIVPPIPIIEPVIEQTASLSDIFGTCVDVVRNTSTEHSPKTVLEVFQAVLDKYPSKIIPKGEINAVEGLGDYLEQVKELTGKSDTEILTFWGYELVD